MAPIFIILTFQQILGIMKGNKNSKVFLSYEKSSSRDNFFLYKEIQNDISAKEKVIENI